MVGGFKERLLPLSRLNVVQCLDNPHCRYRNFSRLSSQHQHQQVHIFKPIPGYLYSTAYRIFFYSRACSIITHYSKANTTIPVTSLGRHETLCLYCSRQPPLVSCSRVGTDLHRL